MDLKSNLIAAADQYCEVAKISKARLATIVANDGKFFARIEAGGGLTLKMYERFTNYFRTHPAEQHGQPRSAA